MFKIHIMNTNIPKATRRKRRRDLHHAVTSDVITLGKPRTIPTEKINAANPVLTAVRAHKSKSPVRHSSLDAIDCRTLRRDLNEIALSSTEFTEKLYKLTVQLLSDCKTLRFSIDEYEKLILIILELNILIRKCLLRYILPIINCVCSMLPMLASKIFPNGADRRWLAISAVGTIEIGIKRIQNIQCDFDWPAELIKCYIHDKMLLSDPPPLWTNLAHCKDLCKQLVSHCLYGRQKFRVNDRTNKLEFILADETISRMSNNTGDKDIESFICKQIFSSTLESDGKQSWAADLEYIPPEHFHMIADCCVYYCVRKHLLVQHKIDTWLNDPKYSKFATEVLASIIVNCKPGEDDEIVDNLSLIGHLLRLPCKSVAIHQTVLQSLHVFLQPTKVETDQHILMYMKECVQYLIHFSDRNNIAMSIILMLFDIDNGISASFSIGKAFLYSISVEPNQNIIFICSTILRDVLLLNSNIICSQLCLHNLRKAMLFDWWLEGINNDLNDYKQTMSLMISIIDLNLISLALEVIRSFKDNFQLITPTLVEDYHTKTALAFRNDIHKWQENCLDFIEDNIVNLFTKVHNWERELMHECSADYYKLVSTCCFLNPQIERIAIVLKGLIAESDCMNALNVIVNVGTNEEILSRVLKISNDNRLPLNSLSILEIIEQILRRAVYSPEYAILQINNIDSFMETVWECCLVGKFVDTACFWRCCFILLFIICLLDESLDFEKVSLKIYDKIPTVRVMTEIILTNQYSNVPEATLLRLTSGCIKSYDNICRDFSSEEEKEIITCDLKNVVSETFCRRWPRQLSEINLGKLKALNHSQRLSNLLTNRKFLIKCLFTDLLLKREANKLLFSKIFTDWAHILLEYFEELVPTECLCSYILKYESGEEISNSANISKIEKVIIDKIRVCPKSSFLVISAIIVSLQHKGNRTNIWKKLEYFFTTTKLQPVRLIEFGSLNSDHIRSIETDELQELISLSLNAISLESDISRGCILWEFILEMCTHVHVDFVMIYSRIMDRLQFWKYLLQNNTVLRIATLKLFEKNNTLHDELKIKLDVSEGNSKVMWQDLLNQLNQETDENRSNESEERQDVFPNIRDEDERELCTVDMTARMNEKGDVDIRNCYFQRDIDLRSWSANCCTPIHEKQELFQLLQKAVSNHLYFQEIEWYDKTSFWNNINDTLKKQFSEETAEWFHQKLILPENRTLWLLLAQRTNLVIYPDVKFKNASSTKIIKSNKHEYCSKKHTYGSTTKQARLAIILLSKAISHICQSKNVKQMQAHCKILNIYLQKFLCNDTQFVDQLLPLIMAIKNDPQYHRVLRDHTYLMKALNSRVVDSKMLTPMVRGYGTNEFRRQPPRHFEQQYGKHDTYNNPMCFPRCVQEESMRATIRPKMLDRFNRFNRLPNRIGRVQNFPVENTKLHFLLMKNLNNLLIHNIVDQDGHINEIYNAKHVIQNYVCNTIPKIMQDLCLQNQQAILAKTAAQMVETIFNISISIGFDITTQLSEAILPVLNYFAGLS